MAPLRPKPDGMSQDVYEGIVVAQTLRAELGLADDAPVDCVLELAERSLGLDVVLAPMTNEISGFYLPTVPTPVVIVQSSHPVQRQRFTLAHELGHHALGHAAAPRIHGPSTTPEEAVAALNADHYRPRRNQDPDERAANAFAGELLVPEAGARRVAAAWVEQPPLDQSVRLSSHFGISAFAALVRLEMLGQLGKDAVRATRAQLAAGEHLARYGELGLHAHDDELQRHADAGGGPRCSPSARLTLARLRVEFDAAA